MRTRIAYRFRCAAFALALGGGAAQPAAAETLAAGNQRLTCAAGSVNRSAVTAGCRLAVDQTLRNGAGDIVPCRARFTVLFDKTGALITCWIAREVSYATGGSESGTRQRIACQAGEQVGFGADGALNGCALARPQTLYTAKGQAIACQGGNLVRLAPDGALQQCRLERNVDVATPDATVPCRAGGQIEFAARLGTLRACVLDRARTLREPSGRVLECKAGGLVHFDDRGGRFITCNI